MFQSESEHLAQAPRRLLMPVVLLLMAGGVASYLACFALPNALVGAELMSPWPPNADPRPMWMLKTFCWIAGSLALLGGIMRFLSWRQCRRIDAIGE